MAETKVNSKDVYSGKFLKVKQDEVKLPDGSVAIREYIVHPGAAMVIPLQDDGKVVMIRQFRYPLKSWFLEFPAGKIDQGEDSLTTGKRELEEETGFRAKSWRFLTTIHPVIGYADEKIDIYLARGLSQHQAAPEAGEHIEVLSSYPTELIEKVKAGEITDVKTQIGIFWLEKILEKYW